MPARARESGLPYEDRSYKCMRADQDAIYAKSVSTHLLVIYL